MRKMLSTTSVALFFGLASLLACADDKDDDGETKGNGNIENPAVKTDGGNGSGSGLDSGAGAGDSGFGGLLGDASIGDFLSDGGINENAICSSFPQYCADGSIIRPDGGFGRDGGFDRDGGFGRDGGRDGGNSSDGAVESDAQAADAASDTGG